MWSTSDLDHLIRVDLVDFDWYCGAIHRLYDCLINTYMGVDDVVTSKYVSLEVVAKIMR